MDAGSQSKLYDYCADTLRSLLPAAERLGVVTAKEVQLDTLADRLRKEANVARTAAAVLPLVGAWCRNSQ